MAMIPATPQTRHEQARQAPLRRAFIIAPTVLTTSAAAIWTAGVDDAEISSLRAANITAGAITVTLYIMPSGGAVADGNAIAKGLSLAANTMGVLVTRDAPIRLPPGASLMALASGATSINLYGMGHHVGGAD